MKSVPHFRASRSATSFMKAAPRWLQCSTLAWSCVVAVGCVAEGAPEELGAVQFNRGQKVVGSNPASSVGPAAAANQPVRDKMPASGSAAPTTIKEMVPVVPAAATAGAPATPPKAQDMGPAKPVMPAAGSAAAPVAGAGAPPVTDPKPSTEAGSSAPPDKPAESAGPGMLTVAFTSVGPGGRYAPRNCGAVWIEDESGKFIKTIERWTAIRERYLEKWSMASGGWGFSIFGGSSSTSNPDQVDVVTAGTLSRHQMHMATWNMKNVAGEVVPDGKYSVVVEVSEGTSGVGRVGFVKGPMAQMLKGDSSVFSNMTVTYSH